MKKRASLALSDVKGVNPEAVHKTVLPMVYELAFVLTSVDPLPDSVLEEAVVVAVLELVEVLEVIVALELVVTIEVEDDVSVNWVVVEELGQFNGVTIETLEGVVIPAADSAPFTEHSNWAEFQYLYGDVTPR